MLNGLIVLVIFAADIWAVVNIFQSNESAGTKALWIVLVAVLPVIGLAVWYFMGPKAATR